MHNMKKLVSMLLIFSYIITSIIFCGESSAADISTKYEAENMALVSDPGKGHASENEVEETETNVTAPSMENTNSLLSKNDSKNNDNQARIKQQMEVLAILKSISSINQATDDQKKIITEFYEVDLASILAEEQLGHSLMDSVLLAYAAKDYGITLEQASALHDRFITIEGVTYELQLFEMFTDYYRVPKDTQNELLKLLIDGSSIDEIREAYILSQVDSGKAADYLKTVKEGKNPQLEKR